MNMYEKEFSYFLKILPDDGIILDIGANIGITTVPLARHTKKNLVYAFEPIPNNLSALKRVINFHKVKNVKIFDTALGDENGSLQMVLPIINNNKMQGLSHVVEDNNNSEWNKGMFFHVTVKRLDDINELQTADKISAIKIDVEGFEYYVLKGGVDLLLKHKPMIYCELWDNEKRATCLSLMKELGYTVKTFLHGQLVEFTNQPTMNFFLMPL
jgi:FkbM family methyltransferase